MIKRGAICEKGKAIWCTIRLRNEILKWLKVHFVDLLKGVRGTVREGQRSTHRLRLQKCQPLQVVLRIVTFL